MQYEKKSLLASALLALAAIAHAVPTEINYQGVLTDQNGNPVNGVRAMQIKIYDAPTGGTLLYSEDLGNVPVQDGIYSFSFGANGTSSALTTETVAIANGTVSTFQKVLAAPTVVAGSVTVTDGTYTWDQTNGSSNENDFSVAYSPNLRRVTVTYYNGAPAAGKTISSTYRSPNEGIVGTIGFEKQMWSEIAINGTNQSPRSKILTIPLAIKALEASRVPEISTKLDSLNSQVEALTSLIAGISINNISNSKQHLSQFSQTEIFSVQNGVYNSVVSQNSTLTPNSGFDINKLISLGSGRFDGGTKTYVINDYITNYQFNQAGRSFGDLNVELIFNDGTKVSKNASMYTAFGFSFTFQNPKPKLLVSSIRRTLNITGVEVGQWFENYRSLSPIEIIISLKDNISDGNEYLVDIGFSEIELGALTRYELLDSNKNVINASNSNYISVPDKNLARFLKIIVYPESKSSEGQGVKISGVTIIKLK